VTVAPIVFLDTNVLLYCYDRANLPKRESARQWVVDCWNRRCGRVSTQVLNEFYANAQKKYASIIGRGDARAEVRRYQSWQPWCLDHPTIESAWAVEARYGFSYWDSLMIAAAQAMGCTHMLTEDLQHDQLVDQLRIINPFRLTPEQLHVPS
jgi:predicted nucleic acid-binding protein